MKQKERELFLNLCNLYSPEREKIEKLISEGNATTEVLGMLFSNRMAGIAYKVLLDCDLLKTLDREFRNSLKNAYLMNESINEDYLGCVKYLSSELNSCNVKYALLKGAYLCNAYPKGCRTSNDIDVLVSEEDVGKVSSKLRMAGFKQGYLVNEKFVPATREEIVEAKMTRGETVPFIKEIKLKNIKYLEVDLNFSLDYKNGNEAVLKKMLDRTQIIDIGSCRFCTLDNIDFLLHLCAHLYKEATTMPWIKMKRDMTFYKYCDIYGIVQKMKDEEIASLISCAKEIGLEKELAFSLKSIDSFFGTPQKAFKDFIKSYDNGELEEVISPREKKIYVYTETDPQKRLFAKDRSAMLKEKDHYE